MKQSQNQTQFLELQQRISKTFSCIFEESPSKQHKQLAKYCIQLNYDIMNFIMIFNNDQQIEMAINFIRFFKQEIQNHIKMNIIPNLSSYNFKDKNISFQNLQNFIQIYQKYISKSNFLLASINCAINISHPKNPKEKLQSILNYLFLEKIYLLKIVEQLFDNFLQTTDIVYQLVQNNQDSWQNIQQVLKQFANIIINLQQNQTQFNIEAEFQESIQSYFTKKYQEQYNKWSQQVEMPLYLRKVKMELLYNEKILNFENDQIKQIVDSLLKQNLLTQYTHYLFSNQNPINLELLLEKFNYQEGQQLEELQLLDELYLSLQQDDQQIKMKIKQKIIQEGELRILMIIDQEITKQLAHSFINNFTQLHQKYRKMIETCFKDKSYFNQILISAFEELVNSQLNKFDFGELLIFFIEVEIESIIKNENWNTLLLDVVYLFQYINQFHNFLFYYQNMLALRLFKYFRILKQNDFFQSYLKIECQIIQNIEAILGTATLQSLRIMIQEFVNNNFTIYEFLTENKKILQAQNPLLITENNWPKFQQFNIELNIEFNEITKLKKYYESQQENKQILWLDFLSYVEIEHSISKQRILMSIPQAIILFVYQYENEFKSIQMISQITKLDYNFIQKNCSLMKDVNILEEVVQQDQNLFRLNQDWLDLKDSKIGNQITTNSYIPILKLKKKKSKRNLSNPAKAQIMKILKIQKEIIFQDLFQIVQENIKKSLKEEVNLALIKQVIEELIENNYLERNTSNPDLLKYV
ncbi:unnamed protein product [Paramecium sonneborni]|uniref:Cullin family profile domain-containing protein n=1 Tax=Paramecium sonneborni TaxID=65129 RepID=A0A8S1RMH9_9CILI|nr:unnamed protein product [Paramecium sonneborni]